MAPRLYALLEAYGRRTGMPVLLNTSFNVAGEPIVTQRARGLLDVPALRHRRAGRRHRRWSASARRRQRSLKESGAWSSSSVAASSVA